MAFTPSGIAAIIISFCLSSTVVTSSIITMKGASISCCWYAQSTY